MPRPHKNTQRREIYFSTANIVAMEALFQSGVHKSGIRYGAVSAFVDRLVTEYFQAHPVVSTAQLKEESSQ